MLNSINMNITLDPSGCKVIEIDNDLIKLLISLIADHIGLTYPFLQSYIPPDEIFGILHNEVASNLNSLMNETSRKNRTISKSIIRQHSEIICDFLSKSIPRPDLLVNDDLYYRLIVPGETLISVPHRDAYFHNILPEWRHIIYANNYKLWIPLIQTSKNSIGIIPSSHRHDSFDDVEYTIEDNEKVAYTCSVSSDKLVPISVPCGSGLLFPPSLIHGSLPIENLGPLRLSIELTLGYSDSSLRRIT